MKTQTAINSIKELQNDDILTGVTDDHAKSCHIYNSPEEMKIIDSEVCKNKGRGSFAELAENKLINLTPEGDSDN